MHGLLYALSGMDPGAFETEVVLERIEMGGSLISKELNKRNAMSSRERAHSFDGFTLIRTRRSFSLFFLAVVATIFAHCLG